METPSMTVIASEAMKVSKGKAISSYRVYKWRRDGAAMECGRALYSSLFHPQGI
jgi:hypothetical protein